MNPLLLTVAILTGDANADFKKFILAELPKVAQAYSKRDIAYFKSMSTSDFSETIHGRTLGKDQEMRELNGWFGTIKSASAMLKLLSSKATGNTATAMIQTHMIVIVQMDPRVRHADTVVIDMWEKETWVRAGKSWKIKRLVEAKPTKMTLNGKPFDPDKKID